MKQEGKQVKVPSNSARALSNGLTAGAFAVIVFSLGNIIIFGDRLVGGLFWTALGVHVLGFAALGLSIFFGGRNSFDKQAKAGIFGLIAIAIPTLIVALNSQPQNNDTKAIIAALLNDEYVTIQTHEKAIEAIELEISQMKRLYEDELTTLRASLQAIEDSLSANMAVEK